MTVISWKRQHGIEEELIQRSGKEYTDSDKNKKAKEARTIEW